MSNYKSIDLFSGAGGLTVGLKNAGFDTVFAVEYNQDFAETFKYNFPKINLLVEDISKITKKQIKELVNDQPIDLIVGGPPCQGFSIAGNIGRMFLEDERNHLFKEFVRVVDIVKPKVFLMENVAGLARHNRGKSLKEIIKAFEDINYKVVHKVVNSVDYGVPQERRRVILIGTYKKENTFKFKKLDGKIKTVFDAISDLPKLGNGEECEKFYNHKAMNHTKQMLEKMSYIKDGGTRDDIPEELRPKSGDARKYIKYDSQKPSITITGDMRKVFHYDQNRALTARELARIQTFPDDFLFKGTSINIQQQIGNAVPPKLAYELLKQIKEQLLDG